MMTIRVSVWVGRRESGKSQIDCPRSSSHSGHRQAPATTAVGTMQLSCWVDDRPSWRPAAAGPSQQYTKVVSLPASMIADVTTRPTTRELFVRALLANSEDNDESLLLCESISPLARRVVRVCTRGHGHNILLVGRVEKMVPFDASISWPNETTMERQI
jgi:hypothetical protein